MLVSDKGSTSQIKPKSNFKRITLLLVILIVVVAAIIASVHFSNPKQVAQNQASTKASRINWHEVAIPSHEFKVSMPCENTVAKPYQGADGLMGTINTDPGFIDAACAIKPSIDPTVQNPGCQAQVLDGVLPKTATDSVAILRTLSGKKTEPVENARGATSIKFAEKNSKGNRANLYAVAGGRYYNVQVFCTTGYEQTGQQFLNSFTPIKQQN